MGITQYHDSRTASQTSKARRSSPQIMRIFPLGRFSADKNRQPVPLVIVLFSSFPTNHGRQCSRANPERDIPPISKNNRGTLRTKKKVKHGTPASAWPATRCPPTKHITHARPGGLLDVDVGHFLICCVPAAAASHRIEGTRLPRLPFRLLLETDERIKKTGASRRNRQQQQGVRAHDRAQPSVAAAASGDVMWDGRRTG